MLGDAQEPDAVPAGPDVGDRAEVVRQPRVVPDRRPRVAVRHEHEEREQRRGPDRQARPERRSRARDSPRAAAAFRGGPSASASERVDRRTRRAMISAWPSATSRPRRRTSCSRRSGRSPRRWSSTAGRCASRPSAARAADRTASPGTAATSTRRSPASWTSSSSASRDAVAQAAERAASGSACW